MTRVTSHRSATPAHITGHRSSSLSSGYSGTDIPTSVMEWCAKSFSLCKHVFHTVSSIDNLEYFWQNGAKTGKIIYNYLLFAWK